MTFGLKEIVLIIGIAFGLAAAAFILFPDVPKFEEAIYALAAAVVLIGGAHFIRPSA